MKKILITILAIITLLGVLTACSSTDANGLPKGTEERNNLNLFVDGADVTDGANTYDDIIDKFEDVEIEGNTSYAAKVTDICAYDLSSVKGAFIECTDGYVRYVDSIEDITLAAFTKNEEGKYAPVQLDGANTFGAFTGGDAMLLGIENIYMLTTACEFEVAVQVNGSEIGKLNFEDFMKKTPVGGDKVATAMYDGTFKYNYGESIYEGEFLGFDFETLLDKLSALDMEVEGKIKEVEYIGNSMMGDGIKNTEYSSDVESNNAYSNVEFFCMYDGMVIDINAENKKIGLSAFINGTGKRWFTYDLSAINFIVE